jgi:hypothetical protein
MHENLNRFDKSRKPSGGWPDAPRAAHGRPTQRKNKSPAWGGAFVNAKWNDCYLAGAVAVSAVDFLLCLLLWLFLL